MNRDREEKSIGDLLKAWSKKMNLEDGLSEVRLHDAWHQTLGAEVSKETLDLQVKGKTLYVRLASSSLRQELSYSIDSLVKHLNKELGQEAIETIRFR